MPRTRRPIPLRIRLLYALKNNGPQTSAQLTLRLDPYPGKTFTQARNGVNGRLKEMKAAGNTEVKGTVPTEYHNTPAFLWQITVAGEEHLAAWEAGNKTRRQQDKDREERAKAKESALRNMIRQALANGWGPGTPTVERREISRKLRAEGLPYDWIAAIFDLSHEQIRQDCCGYTRRKGIRVRTAPQVLPGKGPGYVWDSTRERAEGAA